MYVHPLAEIFTIIAVGITLCGLVGRGVWIMSRLYTKVNDIIIPKVVEMHQWTKEHGESCNPHRQELDFRMTAVETKLAEE